MVVFHYTLGQPPIRRYTLGVDMQCDTVLQHMIMRTNTTGQQTYSSIILVTGLTRSKLMAQGLSGCFSNDQGFISQYKIDPTQSGAFTEYSKHIYRTDVPFQDLRYVTSALYDDVNEKIEATVNAFLVLLQLVENSVKIHRLLMFKADGTSIDSNRYLRQVTLDPGFVWRQHTITFGAKENQNRQDLNTYKIWMQFQFESIQPKDNFRLDSITFDSQTYSINHYQSNQTSGTPMYDLTKIFIRRVVRPTGDVLVVTGQVKVSGSWRILVMKVNDATQQIEESYYSTSTKLFDFTGFACIGLDATQNECNSYRIHGSVINQNFQIPYDTNELAIIEFKSDFRVQECGTWFKLNSQIHVQGIWGGSTSPFYYYWKGWARDWAYNTMAQNSPLFYDRMIGDYFRIQNLNSSTAFWYPYLNSSQDLTGKCAQATNTIPNLQAQHCLNNRYWYNSYFNQSMGINCDKSQSDCFIGGMQHFQDKLEVIGYTHILTNKSSLFNAGRRAVSFDVYAFAGCYFPTQSTGYITQNILGLQSLFTLNAIFDCFNPNDTSSLQIAPQLIKVLNVNSGIDQTQLSTWTINKQLIKCPYSYDIQPTTSNVYLLSSNLTIITNQIQSSNFTVQIFVNQVKYHDVGIVLTVCPVYRRLKENFKVKMFVLNKTQDVILLNEVKDFFEIDPLGYQPDIMINSTRPDLVNIGFSGITAETNFEYKANITMTLKEPYPACSPSSLQIFLQVVDCSETLFSVIQSSVQVNIDINQTVQQVIDLDKMKTWFKQLSHFEDCTLSLSLLNQTTGEVYQSTIPSLQWNSSKLVITNQEKKPVEYKFNVQGYFTAKPQADSTKHVNMSINFVDYKKPDAAPYFTNQLPLAVVDDKFVFSDDDDQVLFVSPVAKDSNNFQIFITVLGLDSIPCDCFFFQDQGNGTYQILVDKPNLLKSNVARTSYSLTVILQNNNSLIANFTQLLKIDFTKQLRDGKEIAKAFNESSNFVLEKSDFVKAFGLPEAALQRFSLTHSRPGKFYSLFEGAVKMESSSFQVQFDFHKLFMLSDQVKFQVVASNFKLKQDAWVSVLLVRQQTNKLQVKVSKAAQKPMSINNFKWEPVSQNKSHESQNFTCHIKSLGLNGDLTIEFSTDVLPIKNLSTINSTVLNVSLDLSEYTLNLANRLKINQIDALSWTLSHFKDNILKLKVVFAQSKHLSSGGATDYLVVQVMDGRPFKEITGLKVLETVFMSKVIRAQIQNDSLSLVLSNQQDTIEQALYSVALFQIGMSLLLEHGFPEFMSLLSNIQMICFQNLLNVDQPANVRLLTSTLISVMSLDMLNPEYTTAKVFNFKFDRDFVEAAREQAANTGISNAFYDMGFDTFNPLLNLGGTFIIICYTIVMITLFGIITLLKRPKAEASGEGGAIIIQNTKTQRCRTRLCRIVERQRQSMLFGQPITLIKEQYIIIVASIMLNFQVPHQLKEELTQIVYIQQKFEQSFAYFMAVMTFAVFPVAALLLTFAPVDFFDRPAVKTKFGSFWEENSLETRLQRLNIFFQFCRKVLLISICLYLYEKSGLQVIAILYLNLIYFVYIGLTKPFETAASNLYNLINEFMTLNVSSAFVLFTDFCPDTSQRYNNGWIYIVYFLTFMIFRIGQMIYPKFKILAIWIKTKIGCKKQKKKLRRKARGLNVLKIKALDPQVLKIYQLIEREEQSLLEIFRNGMSANRQIRFNELRTQIIQNKASHMAKNELVQLIKDSKALTNQEKCKFAFEFETMLQVYQNWSYDTLQEFLSDYLQKTFEWQKDCHLQFPKPQFMQDWKQVRRHLLDGVPLVNSNTQWCIVNMNPLWFKEVSCSDRQLLNYVNTQISSLSLGSVLWTPTRVEQFLRMKSKRREQLLKTQAAVKLKAEPQAYKFVIKKVRDLYKQLCHSATENLEKERIELEKNYEENYVNDDNIAEVDRLMEVWEQVRKISSSTFDQRSTGMEQVSLKKPSNLNLNLQGTAPFKNINLD